MTDRPSSEGLSGRYHQADHYTVDGRYRTHGDISGKGGADRTGRRHTIRTLVNVRRVDILRGRDSGRGGHAWRCYRDARSARPTAKRLDHERRTETGDHGSLERDEHQVSGARNDHMLLDCDGFHDFDRLSASAPTLERASRDACCGMARE
jgi:hypothetical protein